MRSIVPIAVACFLVACSPPPPFTELETDAGALEADAGHDVDAGTGEDAGSPIDAGTSEDAGSLIDAGAPADAGIPFDAGTPIDAGMALDAGTPADAGCVCTQAEYCSAGRCVADTLAPHVTVIASLGTTASTLHVVGSVTDTETGVASLELRVNNASPVTVAVVAGAYDVQLPVSGARAEYTVVATARDVAGNSATAQTTLDAAAPVVVLSPSQDGVCTSMGCTGVFIDAATPSFTLKATVTEGFSLAAMHPVQVRVTDGTNAELVTWTDLVLQPNGSWSWTWASLPALDFTRLTIEVAAIDASNNRGTARLGVPYDRVRPTLTLSASVNASCAATACSGAVVNATSTSLDLTGLVSTDATLSLRVLDGAAVVMAPVAVPQTAGAWSYAWTSFPNVDGRFYSLEVTATDALQNTFSRQLVVLVDRINPSLLVNSPRQGNLVGTAQVTVNASAADGLGLKTVELASSASGPFIATTVDSNGDYVGQLPVPMVDAVEQVLTVRATDLANNVRVASTRYTADRVAPVITVNGTDFDCSGAGACTGSVANAASTQVVYGGTFSDGSAVTLQKSLVGPSGSVAASTDAASGSTWSFTWSGLPVGINGAAYELRVIATDAAGNSAAQLKRRTWLDNVAPTVTIPVAGQRNIDPLAVLAAFSEPMNLASVISATSLTPPIALGTFGAADGMHFQFSAAPAPANYTPQTLTLGSAADKAGNASARASGSFLTVPKSAIGFLYTTFGWQCRSPRIVVDADGRYTVAVSSVAGSTAGAWAIRDIGDGTLWSLGPAGSDATIQVPTDLRITNSARGPDQRLLTQFEMGSVFTNGSGTWLGNASFSIGWSGAFEIANTAVPQVTIGATKPLTLASLTSDRPMIEFVPYRDLISGTNGTRRSVVAPNNGATAMSTWTEQASWTAATTTSLTTFVSIDGRASLERPSTVGPLRVRYWDLGAMSEVVAANGIRSATAQPAFKGTDRFGGVIATSASYVSWTTDTSLSIACSAAPFAAPPVWRSTALTMPAIPLTSSPLSSAISPTTFAIVGEYGGNAYVYSTPLSGCTAAPALTLVGRIDNVSEPAVTIDSTGKIWVAAVTASGGVSVSRF